MMRGWIFALVLAAFSPGLLLAQHVGGGHARRPSPPSRYAEAQQRARYADPQVMPAAAAQAGRPRAPREAAQNPHRRAPSSGGLLGKLGIPNLIPKSFRSDEDAEPFDDAPLPYDDADLGPRDESPRGGQPRQAAPPRSSNAQTRQQAPASRSAMAARQPAPMARPQAAPARTASPTQAPSQVARRSPEVNHRRNELAEALSGLRNRDEAELAVEEPAVEQSISEYAQEPAPPVAEDLPSYLRGSRTAQRSASAPPLRKSPAAAPLDIRDALMGPASSKPLFTAPEPVAADHADLGPLPQSSEPVQHPSEMAAAAPSEVPVPSEAVADEPTATEAEEAFGAIEAREPNPAFAVEPPTPDAPTSEAPIEAPPQAASASATAAPADSVLLTSGQPVIISNIEGPQSIVVGRQAEYRVRVENKGDLAARRLTATIAVPEGAEVVDSVATNGVVERGSDAAVAGAISWQLYELAPGASQTLTIQLIPRSGRELQLGVQWVHAPVVANATVEIQEPKLSMEISGPNDVLYGKSQRYALTISNPGNGTAEDVAIELTPPGGKKDSVVRHKVGALAPGQSKKIELELTAREAGELKILAAAVATGNVRTETVKSVQCRKPELEIDWRGPDKKYAGSVATYYFRVRNPGTASAEQVGVQLNLPAGAELVKASDGHTWDADRRTIVWRAAGLQPGEEQFMELQCRLTQPGVNKLDLTAQTAGGDLSDAKSVAVNVEALADLQLEVSDPKGVLPVGDTAVYEIRITNRGLTAARGVNVVAMFSEGIDPAQVEGGQHSIRDGRISFRTIDSLAAGSETVLKIHAKASKSGTHVFRAEVACEELEAKLAAEETTRFFDDEERWADASTAYAEEAGGTQTR